MLFYTTVIKGMKKNKESIVIILSYFLYILLLLTFYFIFHFDSNKMFIYSLVFSIIPLCAMFYAITSANNTYIISRNKMIEISKNYLTEKYNISYPTLNSRLYGNIKEK